MILSDTQLDTLKEMINIGVGKAGAVLSELVGSTVGLKVPELGICSLKELPAQTGFQGIERVSSVMQEFSGSVAGRAMLVFPQNSGNTLARRLIGDDSEISDIDTEREGALSEVGNILLNSVMGSISNLLQDRLDYALPLYRECVFDALGEGSRGETESEPRDETVLWANARFDILDFSVMGTILLVFQAESLRSLLMGLDALTVAES